MWCFYGMPPRPNPHDPWLDSVGLRYLAGVGDSTKSPVTGLTKATPNIRQLPPSVAVRWMEPLFQTWGPDFSGEMLVVEMCHYNRASLSTRRFSSWLGDCFFLKFLAIILYNIQHGNIQILNLALKVHCRPYVCRALDSCFHHLSSLSHSLGEQVLDGQKST